MDYRDALAKLPNIHMIIEEGGTHPFEGIERFFSLIEDFVLERNRWKIIISIDRGLQSREIISYIRENNHQVVRGNHEQFMIEDGQSRGF